MKRHLSPACSALAAALTTFAAATAPAAETVTLFIQRAPTLNGPWSRLDLRTAPLDVDGNPRLPVGAAREFYLTEMKWSTEDQLGDPIPLEKVPDELVTRAKTFLESQLGLGDRVSPQDPEAWPAGVQLAPYALLMHSVAGDGSVRPSYYEFKVLPPPRVAPSAGWLKNSPDDCVTSDAGFVLLSATEDDFPIVEFSTRGRTPCETLAALAGTGRIRVMRFGPTFSTAEDESGKLLASKGAVPFKPDPKIYTLGDLEWIGDDSSGLDESPRIAPEYTTEPYRDYDEFKKDFRANEIYNKMRQVKRARAKLEWDLELGRPVDGITVNVGQDLKILEETPATPPLEFSFTSDNEPAPLKIARPGSGGLVLMGVAPGDGLLRVKAGGHEYTWLIRVQTQARNVGDVVEQQFWYAGNWGAQPKYHQFENDEWCPLVGCGPVAWAMLLAWFDREWNVEAAFRGEGSGDPPPDTASSSNRSKVRPAYLELHELCDVICWGEFSDQGAVYPTDMSDGIKDYTWVAALGGLIKRSWHINSTTGTWPDGAFRCRDAIKNGYPAVVGLGWMWHYCLAYGYGYQKIDTGLGYTYTRRMLKCNMGWGEDVDPRWYHIGDTFYAADFKITNP